MGEGWDIRLCGPVLVDANGRRLDAGLPGRQGRLLFAYLVLNRTRGCPRDELIDVLWPEGPPAAADSALSALLSKLRRALGDGVLTGRGELRLHLEAPVAGRHRGVARRRSSRPRRRWRAGDHARRRRSSARDALSTDLQTFLPDAEGGWAAEQRRELETIRLRALETLAEAGLRQGGRELGAAEQAARAAIAAAPFRESAHRLLMEVHEAAGNPAEALRAFEELRSLLREELGHDARARRRWPCSSACCAASRRPSHRARGVRSPRVARAAGSRRTWPPPLAAAVDRHALVGRGVELAYLERCWREAADGQRALVLLAGDAGIGKTRQRGRARVARPRRRRRRPVRPLRRGDADPVPARGGDAARVVGGRAAGLAARPARPARRRAARSCCRSSARRPPTITAPARSERAGGRRPALPLLRRRGGAAGRDRLRRRRSCSSSTTCTGPTGRRSSSCATSCARPRRAARCSSAPTARARSPTATRCTS